MPLINYPACPGAGPASKKYQFAEPPALWVGPQSPARDRRTLAERLLEGAERCREDVSTGGGGVTLTVDEDLRPVRRVMTGRRDIPTGTFSSKKCGRSHQYEGMNERATAGFMEGDPGVIAFAAQPVSFHGRIGGRPVKYTPDFSALLTDGRLRILEAKTDRGSIRNPKDVRKLEMAREACGALGWEFVLVEGVSLRASNVFTENLAFVAARCDTAVPTALAMVVRQRLQHRGGSVELGELIDLCGPGPMGLDRVCALFLRRTLVIDLRYPLDIDSKVECSTACGGWQ